MSNEIGVLFDKTQRALKALHRAGKSFKELEQISGEDRSWLRKFINNEITDPGSIRLESVCLNLKRYQRKVRENKK